MEKSLYLDLMDKVVGAYTTEHIRAYTESVIKNSIEEHGFPRLVANLGILIAHGRKTELKDYFKKMMDLCCEQIPVAYSKNGRRTGNDFSVKEVVCCVLELEKAEIFEKSVTDYWRECLKKINPYETYSVIAEVPPKRINNWAAFGAVSEQLRKFAGIGDESAFIENQIASQMFSFDENGMYRDPNEPMVYDLVTRLQLAVALYFGYQGKYRSELEEAFEKSADYTLNMQSVSGEIPYGGRSNQFLHNEAFYAALCEFYADFYKKRNDLKKAGMFKRAGAIATYSVIPWLREDTMYHIKNCYPINSKYGCEDYAYYDKYMVTTASWFFLAYAMADDSIEEVPCPAENGTYICETSPYFHKIFIKYGDYFAEIDTNADNHYDASGLGRIHKRGASSAICLSVPFAKEPGYMVDMENPSFFSICGGIKTEDGYIYSFDEKTKYTLIEKEISDTAAKIKLECKNENISYFEIITVSDSGVEFILEGLGELEILFPIFEFDGKTRTDISLSENCAEVTYKGYKCRYTSDKIKEKSLIYANRNGHYRAACAYGKNRISLKIGIDQII